MCSSPFLGSDDEQIVEEEQVDGDKLKPCVEQSRSLGQFLQLSLLLQKASLGDDGDGLQTATETTSDVDDEQFDAQSGLICMALNHNQKCFKAFFVQPEAPKTAGGDSGQEKKNRMEPIADPDSRGQGSSDL